MAEAIHLGTCPIHADHLCVVKDGEHRSLSHAAIASHSEAELHEWLVGQGEVRSHIVVESKSPLSYRFEMREE